MSGGTDIKRRLAMRLVFITLPLCAACFYAGRFSTMSGHESARPETPVATLPPVLNRPPVPAPVGDTVAKPVPATNCWDEAQWRRLNSQPGTVARNQAMAALLEALAASDPQRALALAQAEKNLILRDTLLHASLRGWGRTAAEDAVNWALANTEASDRSAAIAAIFSGAAGNPGEALSVAQRMCVNDPAGAAGYGNSIIDAFCDAGDFSAAVQFVANADNDAHRSIWMAEAYSRWAALQPEQAAQAAAALTDPVARNEALHGIIGGWAQADPAGLTQFLADLPPGGDRGSMLGQALQSWAQLDPGAVADWINSRGDSPDYDEGVAAVAGASFIKTDVALGWAESINDPQLRSATLANVLHNWVLEDLPAAKQFFDSTKDLLPADRQQISEIISNAEGGGQSPADQ
jgi:hypothetical protein